MIAAEGAIGHIGVAVRVVQHPAANIGGDVAAEGAVAYRRAAVVIVHPAAVVVVSGTVGVAAGDGETIQDGCNICPAASDHVVAVLGIVAIIRSVVTIQITAEDGFIQANIVRIGIRLADASVAAPERNTVDQLEGGCAVAARGGLVRALTDPDFIVVHRSRQGILQIGIGILPTAAAIGTSGTIIDVDRRAFSGLTRHRCCQ